VKLLGAPDSDGIVQECHPHRCEACRCAPLAYPAAGGARRMGDGARHADPIALRLRTCRLQLLVPGSPTSRDCRLEPELLIYAAACPLGFSTQSEPRSGAVHECCRRNTSSDGNSLLFLFTTIRLLLWRRLQWQTRHTKPMETQPTPPPHQCSKRRTRLLQTLQALCSNVLIDCRRHTSAADLHPRHWRSTVRASPR